jgi:polysaccharide biosynthesis transport protein
MTEEKENTPIDSAPNQALTPAIRPQYDQYMLAPVRPFPDQAVPTEKEPSLKDLLRVLQKRRKVIFLTILGSVVLSILYILNSPKLYTATTGIEIKGYAPVLAQAQIETMHGTDTRKLDYQKTTVAKLTRLGLADRVLSRDGLAQEVSEYLEGREGIFDAQLERVGKWFLSFLPFSAGEKEPSQVKPQQDSKYKYRESLLKNYLGLLDVNPIHETSLVEIQAVSGIPALSQKIANTHAEAFIEQLRSERQQAVMGNLKILESQADELKEKVKEAEQKLAKYAEENELFSLSVSDNPDSDNILAAHISDLNRQLTDATTKRIKSESLLREVEQRGFTDTTPIDDDGIRDLKAELKAAEAEYATLSQKVTPLYPSMQALGAKIGSLKQAIQSERRQLLGGLRIQYETDVAAEKRLLRKIEQEELNAHEVSKKMVQYNILQREAQSTRDLYQAVTKQMKESQISAGSDASNILITDYAALPGKPSAPLTNVILFFGVCLGVGCGVGLAFLLEALDNTMETPEDVQASLGLPALGMIPKFQGKEEEKKNPKKKDEEIPSGLEPLFQDSSPDALEPAHQFVTVSAPQASVSEALRTIRASILLSSADNPYRLVLVTSANKGDGKTTLVSNLAITLAQASHRTLLIDCDLRQSRVRRLFSLPKGKAGLVDFLTNQASLEEIICPTTVENLEVVTAGSVPPNPAELIGSQKMGQLLKLLKEHYDYILLDAPPVIPVADSLMLSRHVDGVIVVVRSNSTERVPAQETVRRLQRVKARILGVVLNDVAANSPHYGSKLNSEYYVNNMPGEAVGF